MRLLVDTDVLLELLLKREHFENVFNFFYQANIHKEQTCATAMSFRDIGYVLNKQLHDPKKTRLIQLQAYEMISKVINTSADAAIESIYSDVNDYEDSLQMIAAEEAMCTAIITYNKKDFEKSKLPVYTPEEMCEIWSK